MDGWATRRTRLARASHPIVEWCAHRNTGARSTTAGRRHIRQRFRGRAPLSQARCDTRAPEQTRRSRGRPTPRYKAQVDLPILFEDDDLIAVAKPAGVPVIPGRVDGGPAALRHLLEAARGEALWVVHRIDQDTSGVVVFARSAAAHRALCAAFEHRAVRKTYLAFAFGDLPGERTVDLALHEARRGKARPAQPGEAGGKAARTDLSARARWRLGADAVTLVEARPVTGRHHQIRVHLRALEAPIVGDPLYGKRTLRGAFADAPPLRLALHAARLELPERPPIDAPLPADLATLRAWLDTHAEVLP
ncbi:MAG: RluA family pseudouridine synthase [Myxococcales bacterium]|nr:RluA family pseudouridine synthase [Myxococcales bacterium]